MTASVKVRELAINGGKPVRGKDDPLPSVFPRQIGPNAVRYFQELVESGNTRAQPFDEAFARVMGARFALSVANCTAGVHVALAAAGVGPGDEVAVSPITDYGTIYGILAQRAIPVFADTDPLSGNVTAQTIRPILTERTRAILVVHWAGITCDMNPILQLAAERRTPVIEDCCQSILAEYDGKKTGTLGAIGCFSFDNEKHLSSGSGGAIVTDSEEFYRRASNFADARGSYVEDVSFGRRHKVLGCNYRFDIVRMPMAMAQLDILPRQIQTFRELGALLRQKLSLVEGIIPSPVPERGDAVYWIFPFIVETEKFSVSLDEMAKAMSAEGLPVRTGRYYLTPESLDLLNDLRHTYSDGAVPGGRKDDYLGRSYSPEDTPNAKWYVEHMLCWRFTHKFSAQDIEDIARIVAKVADAYRL